MFPTPPSLEQHPQPSPGAFNLIDTEHPPRQGSPPPEPIEDWTYVFKAPTICKYVGSSKYSALGGLSGTQAPPGCVYRPSWQQQQQQPQQQPELRERTPHPLPSLHSVGSMSGPCSVGGASGVGGGGAGGGAQLGTPSPASSAPPPYPCASACALNLNLLLADTALNIFRDHNFDSCTMCICNDIHKNVGTIRSTLGDPYLDGPGSPMSAGSVGGVGAVGGVGSPPPGGGGPEDDTYRCLCGFSAPVNRRLAHGAGLFYEDEMEITGAAEDPAVYKVEGGVFEDPNKALAASLVELVQEQCGLLGNSASALWAAATETAARLPPQPKLHRLELADSGEVAGAALEAAAGRPRTNTPVHRWPFLHAPAPDCGRDIVRVMRRLQPLLQDAIQKKCSTGMWDAVTGPLTWRQFHRLAGRGTEDLCEPQPVPPLLVGHEGDWVSLSPYALHFWDKLLLEPYSYGRDVGYIALVPDGAGPVARARDFFRDLSAAYEQCRLGRHAPIARLARDGLLRVPRTPRHEQLDEWFDSLPPGADSEILKLYAQMCRGVVAPVLSNVQLDRTLMEPEAGAAPSPMAPPATPATPEHPPTPTHTPTHADQDGDSAGTPAGSGSTGGGGSNSSNSNSAGSGPGGGSPGDCLGGGEEEEGGAPCVVVYLVEPALAAHRDRRTACLAMLRAAHALLQALPDSIRPHVTTQLISCEAVSEAGAWESSGRTLGGAGAGSGGRRRGAQLRSLALSVFSQCRRQLVHQTNIKSLTGFGTAANADLFLKNKDEKNRMPYRLYVPPFVLAPPRPLKDMAETFGQPAPDPCSVLYLSYCLSADQAWLLAVATDGRGELLEKCAINVEVPGRARRRRMPPARRLGLTKLMDFTLGVMSQSVQPWRLVVGRIGRIGHGELKGWSWLLSRKNLQRASTALKDVCASCGLLYPGGAPCILSACLVSTEPDSALRLCADQFTPDERFSQASVASQLSTPHDVTCTHILVFPTSATTQSSQLAFQESHINEPLGDEDLFSADDMPEGLEGMNDFCDIFNSFHTGMPSPGGSPKGEEDREGEGDSASRPGSPGRPATTHARHMPNQDDANTQCGLNGLGGYEKVGTLLQQPLALGYLVSTAPLGRMPAWWWASCPHAQRARPAFLKSALHLHTFQEQQSSEEPLQQTQPSLPLHPLDSPLTTDVLRYVLEGYNALSWLSLDGTTHDRRSCLPAHVQVLMQLYHYTAALV